MSHANAALTPRQRRRLARQIVDDGWSGSAAADFFRVSYPTAAKWARRYIELGAEGMLIGHRDRIRIRIRRRSNW